MGLHIVLVWVVHVFFSKFAQAAIPYGFQKSSGKVQRLKLAQQMENPAN